MTTRRIVWLLRLVALLIPFLITGCAQQPWSEPLADSEYDKIREIVQKISEQNKTCSSSFSTELTLLYQTPLESKSIQGLLRFSAPAQFQFVITNPLGQPVLAVAGNPKTFQSLNTLEKKFRTGSLAAFGMSLKIPYYFLEENGWGWLYGKIALDSEKIIGIHRDRQERGVWIFVQLTKFLQSHILIDLEKERYLELQMLEKGEQTAQLIWSDFQEANRCVRPAQTAVQGLGLGTTLTLKFAERRSEEDGRIFQLQAPPGYFRQYLP